MVEPFDASMTLSRPYLVRAIYQWIIDNDLTPHILVDCSQYGINVPKEHIVDGKVVLNIGLSACADLNIGDDDISFYARFNGLEIKIDVLMASVISIYARENNKGLFFDNSLIITQRAESKKEVPVKPKGPSLTVVK